MPARRNGPVSSNVRRHKMPHSPTRPYTKLAQLETYLFEIVTERFRTQGSIDAFDFFCIVIWKANRAKSRIAKRLLGRSNVSLEVLISELTKTIFCAESHQERLRILMKDWNFRLPMSSAILTVLYPEDFTVYDVRVCDELGKFHELAESAKAEVVWLGYERYRSAVIENTPRQTILRERDRELWGKSFAKQLEIQIQDGFAKPEVLA